MNKNEAKETPNMAIFLIFGYIYITGPICSLDVLKEYFNYDSKSLLILNKRFCNN